MGRWYYGVAAGREPGVYNDVAECHRQVSDCPGANYRTFSSFVDAARFVEQNYVPTAGPEIGNSGVARDFTKASTAKRSASRSKGRAISERKDELPVPQLSLVKTETTMEEAILRAAVSHTSAHVPTVKHENSAGYSSASGSVDCHNLRFEAAGSLFVRQRGETMFHPSGELGAMKLWLTNGDRQPGQLTPNFEASVRDRASQEEFVGVPLCGAVTMYSLTTASIHWPVVEQHEDIIVEEIAFKFSDAEDGSGDTAPYVCNSCFNMISAMQRYQQQHCPDVPESQLIKLQRVLFKPEFNDEEYMVQSRSVAPSAACTPSNSQGSSQARSQSGGAFRLASSQEQRVSPLLPPALEPTLTPADQMIGRTASFGAAPQTSSTKKQRSASSKKKKGPYALHEVPKNQRLISEFMTPKGATDSAVDTTSQVANEQENVNDLIRSACSRAPSEAFSDMTNSQPATTCSSPTLAKAVRKPRAKRTTSASRTKKGAALRTASPCL